MISLKWTNFRERQLLRILDGNRLFASGRSSLFIRLSPKVGVKFYRNKIERNRACRRQELAYDYKSAPAVGSSFEMELSTDLCKPRAYRKVALWTSDCFSDAQKFVRIYGFITAVANNVGKIVSTKETIALENKLKFSGVDHGDLLPANMGRIGKKLVCIDFCSKSSRTIKHRI